MQSGIKKQNKTYFFLWLFKCDAINYKKEKIFKKKIIILIFFLNNKKKSVFKYSIIFELKQNYYNFKKLNQKKY